jgi:hypothetical protein
MNIEGVGNGIANFDEWQIPNFGDAGRRPDARYLADDHASRSEGLCGAASGASVAD